MPIAYLLVIIVVAAVAIALVVAHCWRLYLDFGRFLVERTKTSASLHDGARYGSSFWGTIGTAMAKVFEKIFRSK